jgi:ABC-2 type transport system permease protein
MWLGQMDLGVVISSYFGLLLLGTTFLSIGLLVSGITKHSSAAFIITTIILVLNSLMSQDIVLSKLPPFLVSIFEQLSLPDKMSGFYNGEIGMQAILYLLSVTVVITILAIRANEKNS